MTSPPPKAKRGSVVSVMLAFAVHCAGGFAAFAVIAWLAVIVLLAAAAP